MAKKQQARKSAAKKSPARATSAAKAKPAASKTKAAAKAKSKTPANKRAKGDQYVYLFGRKTDGNGTMKPLLGGKGANLGGFPGARGAVQARQEHHPFDSRRRRSLRAGR